MATSGDAPPTSVTVSADGDWPAQAADRIETLVGTVRDKTTGPAITISKGVVYGLFGAVLGTAALVLLVAGSVRALDNYLPDSVFGERHTWAAHLIPGVVFTLGGLVLWGKRRSGGDEE